MSKVGHKIIQGLEEAAAGNFARVTIEGQAWVKETPLLRAAPKMLAALQALLELPAAKKELEILDRGIGMKTANKAWLEARVAILKASGGEP
jgi:hypothetical protein